MGERVGVPIEGVWHVEHVGDARVHNLFGTTVVPTVFTVEAITASELCATLGLTDCFYSYAGWRAEVERAGGPEAAMALSRPAAGAFWWTRTAGRPTAGAPGHVPTDRRTAPATRRQESTGPPTIDDRFESPPPAQLRPWASLPASDRDAKRLASGPAVPPTEEIER